jgi:hypothetical protein
MPTQRIRCSEPKNPRLPNASASSSHPRSAADHHLAATAGLVGKGFTPTSRRVEAAPAREDKGAFILSSQRPPPPHATKAYRRRSRGQGRQGELLSGAMQTCTDGSTLAASRTALHRRLPHSPLASTAEQREKEDSGDHQVEEAAADHEIIGRSGGRQHHAQLQPEEQEHSDGEP